MVKSVPFTRQFGFELEFLRDGVSQPALKEAVEAVSGERAEIQDYGHQYNNTEWVVKTDSSCGWEVASRVMSSVADLKKAVKVVQAMHRAGAKVDCRCGLHVHVEVTDFNRDALATLVQWWVKFERFTCDVLDPSRKSNTYCLPIGEYFRAERSYDTDQTMYQIEGRRQALNVGHYEARKTIEFRIAQGTNDFVNIKNWVRFLLTFVEFTKTARRPDNVEYLLPHEVLTTMGLLGDELSNGTIELRTWLLDSALKNAEHDNDRKLIQAVQEQISYD